MYEKYSDDELIEAYSSMIEYSGEINKEMSTEIEFRGGLESFKKKIEQKNIIVQETKRISAEVYSLTSPETNLEFIKKLITSNILTQEQLNELIENRFLQYQVINNDKAITPRTILGSITGIILSIILSSLLLFFVIKQLQGFFYVLLIPTYILNYFIIKFITKQTRVNWVIFVATFVATVASAIVSLYITGVF